MASTCPMCETQLRLGCDGRYHCPENSSGDHVYVSPRAEAAAQAW